MKRLLISILFTFIISTGLAQTRPSQLQLKDTAVFDVRTYGATNDDATDDYEAIQAAIAAATPAGGIISLPGPGTYYISKSLVIPDGYADMVIDGGSLGTKLVTIVATTAIELRGRNFPWAGDYDSRCIRACIKNLTIEGFEYGSEPSGGTGIYLHQVGEVYVENVFVKGFDKGLDLDGSEITIDKSIFSNNKVGLYVDRDSDGIFSCYGSVFAGNYRQDVYLYDMRGASFYYCTIAAGGKDFPGMEVGSGGIAKLLNLNGCFFESGHNTGLTTNNSQLKIAGNIDTVNITSCFFTESDQYGSQYKIDIASGANVINIKSSSLGSIGASGSVYIYDIVVRETQKNQLILNFDRTTFAQTCRFRVFDQRTTFNLGDYGESFGRLINCNPQLTKDFVGWNNVGGLYSIASSTLFDPANGIHIAEAASSTPHYLEYYPQHAHFSNATDVITIDYIVESNNEYYARTAINVLSKSPAGAIQYMTISPLTVQEIGSFSRVLTTALLPKGHTFYSVRFGNNIPAVTRKLHYMAIYSHTYPADTLMTWQRPTVAPTTGSWVAGERVWMHKASVATYSGFLFDGTSWSGF